MPTEGVKGFFLTCKQRGIPVRIISHKTTYPNLGESPVNLRSAAMVWLEQQGFFARDGLGVARTHVYFESSRAEKIARIERLGVTHFIDDLEETFSEPAFPGHVEKILYSTDPPVRTGAITRLGSWAQIREYLLPAASSTRSAGRTSLNKLPMSFDLLSEVLKKPVASAEQLSSGGNSRVSRVRCKDGTEYAVKSYFQRTISGLDRLEVEYSGLMFLWENGIRSIPQPLMADRARQVAVYEFVDGRNIASHQITADDVEQAVRFASELRDLRERHGSRKLPPASEACFRVSGVIDNIEGRLRRLCAIRQQGPSYDALSEFLSRDFVPAFAALKERVARKLGQEIFSRELASSSRTLSPSDFGFHNALRRPSGELVYLDFEYFGWDDPAKMISDFILHPAPAMDMSAELKGLFVRWMLDCFSADARLADRLESLYPFFGLKWCMIMLNEFIPKDLERREFAARAAVDGTGAQMKQLGKSRAMLQKIMGEFENFPYKVHAA
ncbi:MAG: phosphotransferase [Acidobacteria bacterium]|nr:phosphotransferase [Acidobacteriota bacterium]